MYLNFDMVASPNYGLFIYDGDGSGFGLVGPGRIGRDRGAVRAVLRRAEHPVGAHGVQRPVGLPGVHQQRYPGRRPVHRRRGAEDAAQVAKWGGTADIAFDPCYHQACDTIDNLSHEALDINADAIAYVTFLYASGGEVING